MPVVKSTQSEVVTSTVYTCSDGKVFDNESSADYHEWTLTATVVYITYCRGQRTDAAHIFSTEEFAELAVHNYSRTTDTDYQIQAVYLDEYIR